MQVLSNMMASPRWGMWFGEPFAVADIADAAEWLRQNGLTECATVVGNVAPMFAFLTDAGIMCVDEFASHTDQYIAWRREAQAETQGQVPSSGPTVSIGVVHGSLQVAGDYAYQVQSTGMSASVPAISSSSLATSWSLMAASRIAASGCGRSRTGRWCR